MTPDRQNWVPDSHPRWSAPLLRWSFLVGQMISMMSHMLCPYNGHRNTLTVEDGLIIWGEALIILPSEREKILQAIHEGHMGISKCQNRARHCVYWPRINSDIKHLESWPTCQHYCPQEPQQPLQPTPAPEHPWQLLSADYFHFGGSEYLVVMEHNSKMPIVRRIPASQCNFLQDHLSPEGTLCRTWHPRGTPYWQWPPVCQCTLHWVSNRLEVWPVTPINLGILEQWSCWSTHQDCQRLLTCAKCSGQDPYLALPAYCSMSVNAHLHSPVEMLYQWVIHTTVPHHIRHTDQHGFYLVQVNAHLHRTSQWRWTV